MIRPAKREEARLLTKISMASKGYWNYPNEYFEIWKDELTINADYISKNEIQVFEYKADIIGYYSMSLYENGLDVYGFKIGIAWWLEHMFIRPEYIGRGVGKKLFHHLRHHCQMKGIDEIGIIADPHSRGFYEKMGCEYQKELPSSIAGRTTPLLVLKI